MKIDFISTNLLNQNSIIGKRDSGKIFKWDFILSILVFIFYSKYDRFLKTVKSCNNIRYYLFQTNLQGHNVSVMELLKNQTEFLV